MAKKMAKAPVYYALVQVCFNPITAMSIYVESIQDLLRKGGYTNFENYREPSIVSIHSSDGKQADTRMELVNTWLFTKTDRTCGFILNQSSLSFHTTHYETSSEFIEAMLYGLGIINELTELDHINRLGMRYLDAVIAKNNEAVQKYFSVELQPINITGSDCILTTYESAYKTNKDLYQGYLVVKVYDRGKSNIGFPLGLNPRGLSIMQKFANKTLSHAVIDTDHFADKQIQFCPDTIKEHLLSIHKTIHETFDKITTSHAKDAWN